MVLDMRAKTTHLYLKVLPLVENAVYKGSCLPCTFKKTFVLYGLSFTVSKQLEAIFSSVLPIYVVISD